MYIDPDTRQKGKVLLIKSCESCNTKKSAIESAMNMLIHSSVEEDDPADEFLRILGIGKQGGATLHSHGFLKNLVYPLPDHIQIAGKHPVILDLMVIQSLRELVALQVRAVAMLYNGRYYSADQCKKIYLTNPLQKGPSSFYLSLQVFGKADVAFNVGNSAIIGYIWENPDLKDSVLIQIRHGSQMISLHLLG
jgi:hypothetical protein